MKAFDPTPVITRTKEWLEQVVIGLNLCPFAKAVYDRNQIRFHVSLADNTDDLLLELMTEILHLSSVSPQLTETTLLIHPFTLNKFLDYNDFLDVADAALIELELVGVIQIASFHPRYQFAGTKPDDIENHTNRSPYPMLHLLREASIEKAVATYPDVDKIPERNIETLKKLEKFHNPK